MTRPKKAATRPQTAGKRRPGRVTSVPVLDPPPDVALGALSDEFELPPDLNPAPAASNAPLAAVPGPLPLTPLPKKGKSKPGTAAPGGPTSENGIRAANLRELWSRIADDPLYHETIVKRAREGRLQPQLEQLIWLQMEGKPPEHSEKAPAQPPSVRIVHRYASGTPKTVEGGE